VYDDYVFWGTLNVDQWPISDYSTATYTTDPTATIYDSNYGCWRFPSGWQSAASLLAHTASSYLENR
jgi:hypothetical protein